jgi:acyl-coenzyme A synthetase/AMP-(fatty) acid ligase
LENVLHGTILGGRISELSGESVLLGVRDQLAAALAIIELDGVARRIIICPPDISPDYIPTLIHRADVGAIVCDKDSPFIDGQASLLCIPVSSDLAAAEPPDVDPVTTEWVLLTSGTSGVPKMVSHSLATLTAPIKTSPQGADIVWGTFYDIRRYGGMQIFLRALLGTGSLVLSEAGEAPGDHLLRLAFHKITHLTGTPSHWRRALMIPEAGTIAPRYVRLSGELVDQGVLNSLRAAYPDAPIGHAYASTEAGVVFEVNDGLEGFPAGFIGKCGDVDIKIEDNSLRIRSDRTAKNFVGSDSPALLDSEGFVDTGDIVEQRDDRYYFQGRRSGIINVGGLKVHPEEIEALLNRHPAVQMSCVHSRWNPITGALVVADVVLKQSVDHSLPELKKDILKTCRETLPRHKVPAILNFVPALNISSSGKMGRQNA